MGLCEVALRDSSRASLGRLLCFANLLIVALAEGVLVLLLSSAPRWRRDQQLYGGAGAVDSWRRLLLATSLMAAALHLAGAKLCHDCGYWWSRARFQSALPGWLLAVAVSAGVTAAAAAVTLTGPARLSAGLQSRLTAAMDGYRDDPRQKAFLDRLQQRSRCCGVLGHQDWLATPWVRREDVPGRGPSYELNAAYDNMLQEDGSLLVKWAPWSCCDPEYGDVCNSVYEVLPHPASNCDSLRQKSSLLQADLPADEQLENIRPSPILPSSSKNPHSTVAPELNTGDKAMEKPVSEGKDKSRKTVENKSTKKKLHNKLKEKQPMQPTETAANPKKPPAPKWKGRPAPRQGKNSLFKSKKKPYTKSMSSDIWITKNVKQKRPKAKIFETRTPPTRPPRPTLYPPMFGFGPPPFGKTKRRRRGELPWLDRGVGKTTAIVQRKADGIQNVTETTGATAGSLTLAPDDARADGRDVSRRQPSGAGLSVRQRRRAYWIVDRKPDPAVPLPPDPRYDLPDGPRKDFLFTAIQDFVAEYRSPHHDCDALLESGRDILAKIEAVPGLPEAMKARRRDSSNYWTLYYVVNGITTTPDPRPYAKYIMRLIDQWRSQDFGHSSPGEVARRVIRYFKPCAQTIRPPQIPSRDCPPPWKPEPGWYLANSDDDEYTREILRPAYNEMEVYLHMERTGTRDVVFTDFRKQRMKREVGRVDEQLRAMQQYSLSDPLAMRYDVLYCRLKQAPSDALFETGCMSAAGAQVAAAFGPLPYLLATAALLQLLVAVLARYLQSANESAARHGDLRLTAYGCLLGRATVLPPEATDADGPAIYTDEDELAEEGIKLARPQERTQRARPAPRQINRRRRKPKKKKKKRKTAKKRGKKRRTRRKRRQ